MPHIHHEPGQHDFTTSAFIVRTDRSEPQAVLHEHRKIGKLLQFGGHIELTESPWQALLREVRENPATLRSSCASFSRPAVLRSICQVLSCTRYPFISIRT